MKAFNTFTHSFAATCCLLLILSSCVESTEISIDEEEDARNQEATDMLSTSVETPTNIIFLIGDAWALLIFKRPTFMERKTVSPISLDSHP